MKLQKLLFAIFTFACFFLPGCQKELHFPVVPGDDPPIAPIATDSADFLERIYYIDSLSGINDTTQQITYLFDNARRVEGQIIFQHNLLAATINYFYNGTDTLPYRTEEVNFENGMPHPQHNDTIQKFFTYSPEGLNLYDSALYSVHNVNNGALYYQLQKLTNRYQHTGQKIYRLSSRQVLQSSVPASSVSSYAVDTADLDIRRNIVAHKHYSILSDGSSQFTNLYTYTYDNKPSPYSRLSSFKTYDPIPLSSPNNKFRIHYEFQGGMLDEDLTGRYTYKANGYPSQLAYPSGSVYYRIEKYFYKTF